MAVLINEDNKSHFNHLMNNEPNKSSLEKKKINENLSLNVLNNNHFFGEKLTVLKLKDLKLTELPELTELYNLHEIDVSGNCLNNLPEKTVNAKCLRILNLSRNNFQSVPDCLLDGLRTLKHLDLSENSLSSFDEIPACLPLLKELILCRNLIQKIPDWILSDYVFMLDIFDLSFNPCFSRQRRFSTPRKNGISGTIKHFLIKNTGFTIVSLGLLLYFPSVTLLDISNCSNNGPASLTNVVSEIEKEFLPDSLEELYLQKIALVCVPDISNLKQLRILDLANNLLHWLPSCNYFKSSITIINLSSTKLIILPDYVGQLTFLTHVMLANNDLSALPNNFKLLVNLEVLDVYNNSIQTVPELTCFSKLLAVDLCWNYFEPPPKPLGDYGPTYDFLKNNLREQYNFQMRFDGVKEIVEENSPLEESSSSMYSISPSITYAELDSENDDEKHTGTSLRDEEVWDLGSDDDSFDPTKEHCDRKETYQCRDFGRNCIKFCPEEIQNSPHLYQPFGERINSECWKLRRIVLERAQCWSPVDGQFEDPD